MRLFGKSKDEIDEFPFDFYSIGHFLFGHLAYLIVFFIALFVPYDNIKDGMIQHVLAITAIIGLGWEVLENNKFIKTSLKQKKDSLNNSLCDILCVILGGILSSCIIFYFFETLLIFTMITVFLLTIEFMLFYIVSTITYNKK